MFHSYKSGMTIHTWNTFVTEYANTHKLSRRDAMTQATRAWAKYKKNIPKTNKIKGYQKRNDVIDFTGFKKKSKPLKVPGMMRSVPQTEVLRRSDLGGNLIVPSFSERLKNQHKSSRKKRRRNVLHDSAYRYMAQKSGVPI